ncbi:imidazole glycerol phosphate synthase subunit HisH [Pontibacillus yanchengensis]|uniref:Imidazole glycerol phosphate synthase subunit HisH n=2 Tax=Pontibacillus yanchengensis TaxID=462910 RepID=A0ACC7VIR4_9BACI|nr:imidazole glycerol phosphate synthase subunit HisH [Pontibacillus yanchengensis]MYL34029.1 imidazole glycerol phosphate synthase subunit HisH [Pontibacillus yanchengensis]MYL54079.1 imidazole glycerol phosphate synthase subunit HisH [Pontibacillus yanchengensis]
MIGIIDYGMGNLFSVSKALERLDVPYTLSASPDELEQCEGLILPGVGAFPDAMKALEEAGMKDYVLRKVEEGTPLLGICLGMQLLFEESEENTFTKGLNLLPGRIVRFTGKNEEGIRFKIPHMGWNHLDQRHPEASLLNDIEDGYVYFVHSYYVDTPDPSVILASASYETDVPAVVGRGNVYGTQFHPEKSGSTGMTILKNFCDLLAISGGKE